jgi:hypothetical protein
MGRKAYRVSLRLPGCRNVTLSSAPAYLCLDVGIARDYLKEKLQSIKIVRVNIKKRIRSSFS